MFGQELSFKHCLKAFNANREMTIPSGCKEANFVTKISDFVKGNEYLPCAFVNVMKRLTLREERKGFDYGYYGIDRSGVEKL